MPKPSEAELKEAFDELDVDKNGSLEFSDLKKLVEKFGIDDISDDKLKEIIAQVDTSGDGKVSFDEFKKAACGE